MEEKWFVTNCNLIYFPYNEHSFWEVSQQLQRWMNAGDILNIFKIFMSPGTICYKYNAKFKYLYQKIFHFRLLVCGLAARRGYDGFNLHFDNHSQKWPQREFGKKTLPSRMLQVSSCQVIWTDPPLACMPAQWRYYLKPFIDFNLIISVYPPIFRYFKYILHVHVIYENVSTKGPPLVWEVQEQWSYNGTMMQDLCLNARHCHTLGPRLLILVK